MFKSTDIKKYIKVYCRPSYQLLIYDGFFLYFLESKFKPCCSIKISNNIIEKISRARHSDTIFDLQFTFNKSNLIINIVVINTLNGCLNRINFILQFI